MAALSLTFQDTQFDVVDCDNQPWLRLHQIGVALGYSRPDAVNKIYQSNADEFTDAMTALVELETNGGKQQVRIFSLRGCHLLAMFARTEVAKQFRKWALDILDKETHATPPPEPKTKKALAGGLSLEHQDVIKALVKQRAEGLPKEKQAKAVIGGWSAIKSKYGCSYKQIPDAEFVNVVSLLARLPLDGEVLEPPKPAHDSVTFALAPLPAGVRQRRWLVVQHGEDFMQFFALGSGSEAREQVIRELRTDGYIVLKPEEFVSRLTA